MSLLTPGAVLRYATADGDASATYCFQVLGAADELVLTSAFAGGEPDAIVRFTGEALALARSSARLSQGAWRGSDGAHPRRDEDGELLAGDLPPFLLARAALRELRAGATRLQTEGDAEPAALTLSARETATIAVDGEPREVAALRAEGAGIELQVLDDELWPLVLARREGARSWRLLAVDHEDPATYEDEDDDDDDLPREFAGPLAPTGPISGDDLLARARALGVTGVKQDHARSRLLLHDAGRRIVIAADYKIVFVALPGGVLRRAHLFGHFIPDAVLGPLGADDPDELTGTLPGARAVAEALAARAGADVLYPEPLGPMVLALFDVKALSAGDAEPG